MERLPITSIVHVYKEGGGTVQLVWEKRRCGFLSIRQSLSLHFRTIISIDSLLEEEMLFCPIQV